ncbi:MAG: glycosyltransferase family protein, partial [Angustibacter sp.]
LSYLWVISHPAAVSDEEVEDGWASVYVASRTWRAGQRNVVPLLQATGARFTPGLGDPSFRHDVLFVGTSRRIARPVVLDAAASGADLAVYGHDWEDFLEERYRRGVFLPFDRLPDAYRGARRVLNDHWPDMRDDGFVSNRLFDATATGARVITDEVDDLDSLFHGLAKSYGTPEELQALLSDDGIWPDAEERVRLARQIISEHSFDQRAEVLISRAVEDLRKLRRRPTVVLRDVIRGRR